jgi:hypothetical protein
LFTFTAPTPDYHAKAGVSTKPLDGTLVDLTLRPAEVGNERDACLPVVATPASRRERIDAPVDLPAIAGIVAPPGAGSDRT